MNKQLLPVSEDIVTPLCNDIFFLDSNVVVAYLNDDDQRHPVVYDLLQSLTNQIKLLCMNVTVVQEALHSLSRTFYAEDMLKLEPEVPDLPLKKQKELHAYHSRNFINATKPRRHFSPQQIKTCNETLLLYNTKALEKLVPFINNFCFLIYANRAQFDLALDLFTAIPLHSADAMIAASAIHYNTNEPVALITLDRDLSSLPDIPVYFFDGQTHEFTRSERSAPLHPTVLS